MQLLNCNKPEFFRRYVKMDKTWLHRFTPKSSTVSHKWTARDEPNSKRGKTQQSAGKVIASLFWDARGIICIDYLEKRKNTNANYYLALLDRLRDEIEKFI